jgi:hypothetical protein
MIGWKAMTSCSVRRISVTARRWISRRMPGCLAFVSGLAVPLQPMFSFDDASSTGAIVTSNQRSSPLR